MPEETPPTPRYAELGPLGEGSWARVHQSLDRHLRRVVAIKELQEGALVKSPLALPSFEREVRVVSYLDHPGILPLYDRITTPEGAPAYSMRVAQGQTLESRIAFDRSNYRSTPQSVFEAVRILKRLSETLAHAHDRGILHLDLKPANVMVGRYGEVVLLDWGNARLFDPDPYRQYLGDHATQEDIEALSREPVSRITGTALFMSPEQIDGDRTKLRPPSDVFSAGALFYLTLFGRPPFLKRSLPETLMAIQTQELQPLERLRYGVPKRLAEITARMLAKDPEQRYPNFHELLHDLEEYQAAGRGFELLELGVGDVLFHEGDQGSQIYSVVSGRVGVERAGAGGARHLGDIGPGEIVGELAILADRPRSATVRAVEPTQLRVLPRERVLEELEKLEPWMGSMVTTMATRFLGILERGD